jgi:hypothetical protein
VGAVQTIVRPYGASLGVEKDNTLTVTVNPVSDNPSIYAAYVKFLNYDNISSPKRRRTNSDNTDDELNSYDPIPTGMSVEKFPIKEVLTTIDDASPGAETQIDETRAEPKAKLKSQDLARI